MYTVLMPVIQTTKLRRLNRKSRLFPHFPDYGFLKYFILFYMSARKSCTGIAVIHLIQRQYISFIILYHTHIHKTDFLVSVLFLFIQFFSYTPVNSWPFRFIMPEHFSIRNPDLCFFDFFINYIHHFFYLSVIWKCVIFCIIVSGYLKHPFCNLFFLF